MQDKNPTDNTDNSTPSNKWDIVERIVKAISIAAIPVVLAAGSWIIQSRLQEQTVQKDYVEMAVTILKEPDTNKELRDWAADLLQKTSPVEFKGRTLQLLKDGTVQLPASTNTSNETAPQAPAANESASDLELRGFGFLFEKNFEAAFAAFKKAEKLSPYFHNVAEIRKELDQRKSELTAADNVTGWKSLYRTIREKYSWRMSSEIKTKLEEAINKA